MYSPGKVLILGGGPGKGPNYDQPVGNPTATAEIIDLNVATPRWRYVSPMRYARRYPNATILPDGKVLVTGGTASPDWNNATDPVLATEMWDPVTGTWSTMASMDVPRALHSTAVLLPDGRVLSVGSGQPPATADRDRYEAEIYSPPYLFKGARPTIASAPMSVRYGQVFSVKTPNAERIQQVTLVRLSSVTHAFNQNQRFNRLQFTRTSGELKVLIPTNRNRCPPGHYMLFLLNEKGVPSVARIIQVR